MGFVTTVICRYSKSKEFWDEEKTVELPTLTVTATETSSTYKSFEMAKPLISWHCHRVTVTDTQVVGTMSVEYIVINEVG